MSQITDESLREAITQRLGAVHVEVTDMSGTSLPLLPTPPTLLAPLFRTRKTSLTTYTGGCGQAFNTLIVSPQFQGLNSLKRHRLVNAALKEEIAAIHAWTAKCQTQDEYERDKAAAARLTDLMEE
ncbi:bola domain-containing protein [Thelonectria olida]|uniref:Bola domain-containing protein n=1 Tax=Thelonectria olida TaxID=1576542 RepID=A0A9P8W6L4_9HYPO|nr:bola domain-containing protein [Thelonectria olida]